MQESIFVPFFATMVLTFMVWLYMYARRIPFITGGRRLTPTDLGGH